MMPVFRKPVAEKEIEERRRPPPAARPRLAKDWLPRKADEWEDLVHPNSLSGAGLDACLLMPVRREWV
ncbi:hypothetical protein NGR_b11050 (plasmid) [Sinorhizobium fredii NGR234]|uniref:Uncharacterized protein n=1 Tax=Sinorhizobium fredii (strain NBRC 101917 / NGR234) TaxID=394 RepID=C3KR50_SINFN|nr:hypothetical protein NGR_b11050 [Sinorhizobium fredii NGR234]